MPKIHWHLEPCSLFILAACGKKDRNFVLSEAEPYGRNVLEIFADAGHLALNTNGIEISKPMLGSVKSMTLDAFPQYLSNGFFRKNINS